MPVSIVVGGQFGSEGKGKVAHKICEEERSPVAVRVGGCNSGHIVVDNSGREHKFQVLPTAALLPHAHCMIAAGSYIDTEILQREIEKYSVSSERLAIDPNAVVIGDEEKNREVQSGLGTAIGSTASGTGAAVVARLLRNGSATFASEIEALKPYVKDTRSLMRNALNHDSRIVIEGTQGFGLSPIHSEFYPYVTSRDTTAAAFLAETGLSPLDVDDVVLVLRAFPIRVAGNSGPLPNEIDWDQVTQESGYSHTVKERTTVTNKVRRVARFDPAIVRGAIEANNPSRIVMNHLDYVSSDCSLSGITDEKIELFLSKVEAIINRKIDLLGLGPSSLIPRNQGNVIKLRA